MSVKEQVLLLLEESRDKALSGQEIADRLKVTRAAVWKAVKGLQAEGYAIEGVNNKGYLLEKAPECSEAIADQFGNEQLLLSALKEKGRRIRLIQRPRAESDMAVGKGSGQHQYFAGTVCGSRGNERYGSFGRGAVGGERQKRKKLFFSGRNRVIHEPSPSS